jgi:hypothetical protein
MENVRSIGTVNLIDQNQPFDPTINQVHILRELLQIILLALTQCLNQTHRYRILPKMHVEQCLGLLLLFTASGNKSFLLEHTRPYMMVQYSGMVL